ncbi:hypothetical protein EMIHUDRAFT_208574 [Emiliania huxleyi CCMP1516]|uniref:Uncharacterized protein n=2 Tax=Emiliania huxleyi TaxID=2903 RepID=A0A0D3JAT2_EMIH1|nr:hypothetical protein EMIHUDRAFT_208574 [Emiliania huxleyi CCMP1516]EOD20617.1 hypothetical protein EMIHUDRAFT_208574 [Emiliania huxleyi CCMP1516]|eukprot:XP_005773046.1 hypothetical protein EMIHUDRAFT_208574 [Emiliania huxleyi CCMP1516]
MSQRRVLAVNHVVELLVLRASGASREALQRVMPERRGAVVAAEDVSHAGRDEEARRAGFDWAVKIGSFIA